MSENSFCSMPQNIAEWLLENYEASEDTSVPRSTIYASYMRHCAENNIVILNPASFGKMIRSVFCGIQTRRLGTRGNSKYHYHGIKLKPESDRFNTISGNDDSQGTSEIFFVRQEENIIEKLTKNEDNCALNQNTTIQIHEYLGTGSNAIPEFPEIILPTQLSDESTYKDMDIFRFLYREHCESILNAVLHLEFTSIEALWREFWLAEDGSSEVEKYLSKSKLFALYSLKPVQLFIYQIDVQFYKNLIQVLLPDIIRPVPFKLMQAIQIFAKNLERWLSSSMMGWPQTIINVKLKAVLSFSSNLLRYLSLNEFAQKARIILRNSHRITQMLINLNEIDFSNMKSQMLWICEFDYEFVLRLIQDFKLQLQQFNSLEQWASHIRDVVQTTLKPFMGKPNYMQMARQFFLKWSFFSSMVIKELTIAFDSSFGSFQMIRLVCDEYIFYLIHQEFFQPAVTNSV